MKTYRGRWFSVIGASFTACATLLCGRVAHAGPEDADALFKRAVDALRNDARAPYARYTVVVTVDVDGRRSVRSWPTIEDLERGVVMPSSFSDEERANPTTPHGINILAHRRIQLSAPRSFNPGLDPAANLYIKSAPVNPERNDDAVGPVALAVDQNFGVTPPHAYRLINDQHAAADAGEEPAIIGTTRTTALRYRVALVSADGEIAHLALTPLRDAYHNRVRDLWIDQRTGALREAIVQGVGDRPPFDAVRWHVDFTHVEGATYLSDVHPVEPLTIGRKAMQVDIAFEKLALLSSSPLTTTFGIEARVRYLRDP